MPLVKILQLHFLGRYRGIEANCQIGERLKNEKILKLMSQANRFCLMDDELFIKLYLLVLLLSQKYFAVIFNKISIGQHDSNGKAI